MLWYNVKLGNTLIVDRKSRCFTHWLREMGDLDLMVGELDCMAFFVTVLGGNPLQDSFSVAATRN